VSNANLKRKETQLLGVFVQRASSMPRISRRCPQKNSCPNYSAKFLIASKALIGIIFSRQLPRAPALNDGSTTTLSLQIIWGKFVTAAPL
jgi:hypothetical protein